jgi:hypothetical protein
MCSSSGRTAQAALGILRALLYQLVTPGLKFLTLAMVRVISVGCTREKVKTLLLVQLTGITSNISSAACVAPLEDEQVMFETCRGH